MARDTDLHRLKAIIGIQNELLDASAAPDPEPAMIRRLAGLLDAAVVLYGPDGEVATSVGTGPTRLIEDELRAGDPGRRRFAIGRWTVLAEPIAVGDSTRWLAIATRDQDPPRTELHEAAIEAARRLLHVMARSDATIRAEDRLRRAELLRLLLSGRPLDEAHLWDRLERYRFERREPLRVVVFGGEPGLLAALERDAVEIGLPVLLAPRDDGIVALAAARDGLLAEWTGQVPAGYRCGLSEECRRVAEVAGRLREADVALVVARESGARSVRFEDLGMSEWLIAGRDAEAGRAKSRQVLAPIADNPLLVEALVAYVEGGLDVTAAARHLRLHPNSVRYRLRRVEALLARDLHAPGTISDLYLALHPATRDVG